MTYRFFGDCTSVHTHCTHFKLVLLGNALYTHSTYYKLVPDNIIKFYLFQMKHNSEMIYRILGNCTSVHKHCTYYKLVLFYLQYKCTY